MAANANGGEAAPIGEGAERALVWFRRDLRAEDNAALSHALRAARRVWCAFVLDRNILDPLPRADRRVELIRASLVALDESLASQGAGLSSSTATPSSRYRGSRASSA
jgi:deoxyribodipyrimidine photolyase